jgi:SAM-dependent methyltransferase
MKPSRAEAQSYDRLAEHYDHLGHVYDDAVARWLPAAAGTGRRAIDVGCGGGRHAVVLARSFSEVVAIDLSAPMVDLARTKNAAPNIEYLVADLFDISGTYDLVFTSAMLHHVDDLDTAIRHLRSLVAPDGIAILLDVVGPASRLRSIPLRIAPRLMYRTGATLELFGDLVGRERGAWPKYRLKTFGPWLDHLATDRFLSPRQFDEAYGAALPGADFVPLGHLRAAVWHAAGAK